MQHVEACFLQLSMVNFVISVVNLLCVWCVSAVSDSDYRTSKLSAVYTKYDYLREEVSVAVYRVQVVWYMRHVRQWREFCSVASCCCSAILLFMLPFNTDIWQSVVGLAVLNFMFAYHECLQRHMCSSTLLNILFLWIFVSEIYL